MGLLLKRKQKIEILFRPKDKLAFCKFLQLELRSKELFHFL